MAHASSIAATPAPRASPPTSARSPSPTEGELRTFTIVAFAAPGVEVPFVSGVIDCDGTSVRGNLRNVEPDAEHVTTGMKVRLTTYSLGTDDNGVEAIGFGFEPA